MSPYNISPDQGGDNETNVKWLEKCVNSVMKTGKAKGSAIAICKSQLRKNKQSKSSEDLEDVNVDPETENQVDIKVEECIKKKMKKTGCSMEDAKNYCEGILSKSNYELDNFTFILDKEML